MVLEVGAPSQQAAVQLTLSLTLTPTLSPNPSPGSPRRGHLLRSQARVLDRLFRVRVRARVRVRISDSVRVRVVVSCPACCMAMYAYLALRPMNRACFRSMNSSQLISGVPQMCDFMPGCPCTGELAVRMPRRTGTCRSPEAGARAACVQRAGARGHAALRLGRVRWLAGGRHA